MLKDVVIGSQCKYSPTGLSQWFAAKDLLAALGVLDSFIQTAARKVHPFESSASCKFDLVFNPGVAIHSCNYTSSTKLYISRGSTNCWWCIIHPQAHLIFSFFSRCWLLYVTLWTSVLWEDDPKSIQIYELLDTAIWVASISGWLEHVGIMGTIKTSRAFKVYCAVTRQQRDPWVHLSGLSASNDFEQQICHNW